MSEDRADQEERDTRAPAVLAPAVRELPPPFQVQTAAAQLLTLIERLPLGCLISDANFLYTHWNLAAEKLFDWKQDEVRGKHPFEVIVPRDAQPYVAGIFERLRLGEPQVSGRNPNQRRDGSLIWCRWSSTPLLDAEGQFAGILSLAQDVTEAVQMQEALRASEQRYRTIVEMAQEGIWMIDPAGRTVFANRRLAELLGWTVEEMRGQPFASFLFEEDQPAGQTYLEDSRQGPVRQLDLRFRQRDHQALWALVVGNLLRDERDQLLGSLLLLTDITERRFLELQFLEAKKLEAVGRLAAGVANDFNNLLTVITGYSELLLHGLVSPTFASEAQAGLPAGAHAGVRPGTLLVPGQEAPPFREVLREIHEASIRATGLTRRLLDFSHKSLAAEARPGAETVLLVEDETELSSVGRLVLQAWGYKVLEARSGPEALALVEKHSGPIHLLIADLVLAQLSGPQLAEQAQRLRPGLKVLFLVGVEGAANLPVQVASLQKPFTPTQLAARVRAVLEGKE